ncbi:putative amino acid permease [Leishmania major strain Friedlin]|uniref:Putative amino acid permease n=1 Tax=Leishmania major TaxID=5664 RepID=E9AG08_LEIMA|nr:putative amino acid permease [Leishmania major strain Friedlin]CAG9582891.1 amino_acid_permease_-_putative [Leishmania major strain Friedlin]CBZ13163.1 putative amino acid permease [Leishmania major strain Friedlin]|eukprot:XP_003722928.1 putative amino acid permease [Leishmania major strain Friedlin]
MKFWDHVSGRGVVGAALNLSVTTIGAGVLVIPSTFQDGGICFVVGMLVLVGFMTVLSIDYLIRCIHCLHLKSYEDISRELLGRWFEETVRWILIFYNIGMAAGYIVVIRDIFTPILPLIQPYLPFLADSLHLMIMAWAFVMLPLSCIPKITKMNYICFVAITATFLISAIIVYRYLVPYNGEHNHAKVTYLSLNERALLAMPVMMYSFDCQSLVFQIYNNLKTATRANMMKVASLSVSITGLVYLVVGLFGYLTHTPNITGNILANYDPFKDHLFAFGEAVYSFTVMAAYVLVLFPCRDAVFILLYGHNTATHELADAAITTRQNLVASVLLSTLSVVLAMQFTGIVVVIALLGGLCSSTICFSYPAAFRIMLHIRGLDRCKPMELVTAISMLAFGVLGGSLGTFIAIRM